MISKNKIKEKPCFNWITKIQYVLVISSLISVAGCGSSGAPNCSDSDVKDLVINISNDALKNQLIPQAINTQLQASDTEAIDTQLKKLVQQTGSS